MKSGATEATNVVIQDFACEEFCDIPIINC